MSASRTMSVIVVQLDDADGPVAYVASSTSAEGSPTERMEIKLPCPQDVTDRRDWVRQILAAVTEAV